MPYEGGSNENAKKLFLSKIRNIIYTPVNPAFSCIKVGFQECSMLGAVNVKEGECTFFVFFSS